MRSRRVALHVIAGPALPVIAGPDLPVIAGPDRQSLPCRQLEMPDQVGRDENRHCRDVILSIKTGGLDI